MDNLRLSQLLSLDDHDADAEQETLEFRLGRLLSIRSAISTTSSFAEQQQTAADGNTTAKHRLIGWGACGAVYARDGNTKVLKLAKTDDMQLWNDYVMNTRVWEAILKTPEVSEEVHVPCPDYFVAKTDEDWWEDNRGLLPAKDLPIHVPCGVYSMERIFPMPSAIRMLLVEKFCAERHRTKALAAPGNKDCLVRIYLGSRQGRSGGSFFSLRNFKLHLNQMEELEMDTIELAMFMAGALAALHWQAGIDARDVEFVLGSAPTFPIVEPLSSEELQKMDPNTSTALRVKRKINFSRRSLHLWVLDFNQCSEITMDNDGIKKVVNAYRVNDPYFPKPSRDCERDIDLWNAFAIRYLKVSDRILRHENPEIRNLPKKFIQAVIVDYEDKQQQKAAAAAASESYHP